MADDERHPSGTVPRMFEEFVSQLHAGTERLEALARSGARLPLDIEHRVLGGRRGQEPS